MDRLISAIEDSIESRREVSVLVMASFASTFMVSGQDLLMLAKSFIIWSVLPKMAAVDVSAFWMDSSILVVNLWRRSEKIPFLSMREPTLEMPRARRQSALLISSRVAIVRICLSLAQLMCA